MALTCPTDLTSVDLGFTEFIDCSTVSINYNRLGNATVSFTVISSRAEPADPTQYNELSFGGVTFIGYVSDLTLRRIPGTLVYEHRYTIQAIGC